MAITLEIIVTWLGLIITIGSFIWKAALLSAKIEKTEEVANKCHDRLDKYTVKHESEIDELRAEIKNMGLIQARMEEKLNMIIDLIRTK